MTNNENLIPLHKLLWEPDKNHCTCKECRSIRWNKDTELCNVCEYEGF